MEDFLDAELGAPDIWSFWTLKCFSSEISLQVHCLPENSKLKNKNATYLFHSKGKSDRPQELHELFKIVLCSLLLFF